jgi:hypothetical protein
MTLASGQTYKQTWVTRFGTFDALHREELFDGEDALYGIPDVLRLPLPRPLPEAFIDWPHRRSFPDGTGLHFFVDDYQFERVWNHPHWYVEEFKKRHPLLFSPDFSVFRDTPLVMQIWQTYRTRWLCRWYQEQGVTMFPTVSWGDNASYDFVFRGIPKHSVIAISTIGRKTAGPGWDEGFIETIDRIDPELVFVVGPKLGEDLERLANRDGCGIHYYESHRNQRLKAIRNFEKATGRKRQRKKKSDALFDWTSKDQ